MQISGLEYKHTSTYTQRVICIIKNLKKYKKFKKKCKKKKIKKKKICVYSRSTVLQLSSVVFIQSLLNCTEKKPKFDLFKSSLNFDDTLVCKFIQKSRLQ